jgi:hypothetical protein
MNVHDYSQPLVVVEYKQIPSIISRAHRSSSPNLFFDTASKLLQCNIVTVVRKKAVPVRQPAYNVSPKRASVTIELNSICLSLSECSRLEGADSLQFLPFHQPSLRWLEPVHQGGLAGGCNLDMASYEAWMRGTQRIDR